jgi:hypothetical protein
MRRRIGFPSRVENRGGRLGKHKFILYGVVMTILFLCGPALAVPFTWIDTISTDKKIDWFSSYSYSHYLSGFVPGQDAITGYSLAISLSDDKSGCDEYLGSELFLVDLPGFSTDGFYSFSTQSNQYDWSLSGVANLNKSGSLNVTISSLWGDFYFDSSTLTASGHQNAAPVPEPASMILFGTGLIVFGFAGRKLKAR